MLLNLDLKKIWQVVIKLAVFIVLIKIDGVVRATVTFFDAFLKTQTKDNMARTKKPP